jgi:hypothetical protein
MLIVTTKPIVRATTLRIMTLSITIMLYRDPFVLVMPSVAHLSILMLRIAMLRVVMLNNAHLHIAMVTA